MTGKLLVYVYLRLYYIINLQCNFVPSKLLLLVNCLPLFHLENPTVTFTFSTPVEVSNLTSTVFDLK